MPHLQVLPSIFSACLHTGRAERICIISAGCFQVSPTHDLNHKSETIEWEVLKKVRESLTFSELQLVIIHCNTLEEKALIELAVSTGIRREDIVNIELSRIDLKDQKLIFWEEKKDRLWMVGLPIEVVQTLKMYIHTLPSNQRFLFNFSGRTAYNKLQRILQRACINKHIAFHDLRRTFIRLSKRMGRDIRFVMDQTGDTARIIMEEYEGYTVDEMVEMMNEDNILRRAQKTMNIWGP